MTIPKMEVLTGYREDKLMALIEPHLRDPSQQISGFANLVKACVKSGKIGMLSTFAEWGMSHPNPKTRELCQETLNILRTQ